MPITRLSLHEIMMEFPSETVEKRKNRVLNFLKEYFRTNDDEDTRTLTEFTRNSFFAPYLANWRSVNRKNDKFLLKYHQWLQKEIIFPKVLVRCLKDNSSTLDAPSISRGKTIIFLKKI